MRLLRAVFSTLYPTTCIMCGHPLSYYSQVVCSGCASALCAPGEARRCSRCCRKLRGDQHDRCVSCRPYPSRIASMKVALIAEPTALKISRHVREKTAPFVFGWVHARLKLQVADYQQVVHLYGRQRLARTLQREASGTGTIYIVDHVNSMHDIERALKEQGAHGAHVLALTSRLVTE